MDQSQLKNKEESRNPGFPSLGWMNKKSKEHRDLFCSPRLCCWLSKGSHIQGPKDMELGYIRIRGFLHVLDLGRVYKASSFHKRTLETSPRWVMKGVSYSKYMHPQAKN